MGGHISYLHYFCLCSHSGVQHILCCIFVLFFFILSVPLDCPFVIVYNICGCLYSHIQDIVRFVFVLFCFSLSYVPYVGNFSRLSFLSPPLDESRGYIGILMFVRQFVRSSIRHTFRFRIIIKVALNKIFSNFNTMLWTIKYRLISITVYFPFLSYGPFSLKI